MASFYSNENFLLATVRHLRQMGHGVLTTHESGASNQSIPDDEVLLYATSLDRCILTLNRRDFMKLHFQNPDHSAIIVCTTDGDYRRQAEQINATVQNCESLFGLLLRVYKGNL